MRNDAAARVALRTLAVVIAAAGVVDPAITSRRATKADVVVLAADTADAALAGDVARSLAKRYTVTRGPISGASATIVAGRRSPASVQRAAETGEAAAPVFAVSPPSDRPTVTIESLDAPSRASALSRVRVDAIVRATGARGKTIDITLRDGAVAVDHLTRTVTHDDDTLRIALVFVPPSAATTTLRLVAHVDGASDANGSALVDIQERKWAVLFYDPRPSWMSTFVRRAIERDPRFVATSRVVTSRDVDTDAGNPPGRLDDLAALSLFDAVVVGAPQAMSANDVAGLNAFMRRRGGSVVLLLDEETGGPADRLIDVPRWTTLSGNQIVRLPTPRDDSLSLETTSMRWPASLPTAARALTGGERPIVWEEPVGVGALVVSGALDAWRFRDPATSAFDRFWQTTIGDAASRTPAPVTIDAQPAIVAPGERFDVEATLRDEAIDDGAHPSGLLQVQGRVGANVDSGASLRLWPRAPGRLVGRVRAPNSPGLYHVAVIVGDRRANVPLVVGRDLHRVARGAEEELVDVVRATGGSVIAASQIAQLPSVLANAIHTEPQLVTWHPMRSWWWILPFVLGASAEWWLRRREGLP